MTLYVVDHERKELHSKSLSLETVKEIRLSINDKSVAGCVALTGQVVSISDAYNAAESRRIPPALIRQ